MKYTQRECYNEFYLKKAIEEIYGPSAEVTSTSTPEYLKAEGITADLIFPKYMINTISKIPKIKTNNFYFKGSITKEREWVNNYAKRGGIIQRSTYGRNNATKYKMDMDYYNTLCKTKFALTPTGDCPWSYRFFEAIMCFAIPILEKDTNDIYCKDFFYFTDGDAYVYDIDKCKENYEKLIERFTFMRNIPKCIAQPEIKH
jgi:hypothetical protein